jgi:hypothetical protein
MPLSEQGSEPCDWPLQEMWLQISRVLLGNVTSKWCRGEERDGVLTPVHLNSTFRMWERSVPYLLHWESGFVIVKSVGRNIRFDLIPRGPTNFNTACPCFNACNFAKIDAFGIRLYLTLVWAQDCSYNMNTQLTHCGCMKWMGLLDLFRQLSETLTVHIMFRSLWKVGFHFRSN